MPGALLLTPGAGARADDRTLLAVEAALAPVVVHRVALPPGPTRAVPAVARHVAELGLGAAVVVGGRSYGGRMCSLAVAQGLPVAGLVLLSFPLHPPARAGAEADLARGDHLRSIDVPILAVSGERDPFARPHELRAVLPAHARLELVPGAHAPADDGLVARLVAAWWRTLR